MSGHEYVFIDQIVLDHPIEQSAPPSAVQVINLVEESDLTFDQHTIEVF